MTAVKQQSMLLLLWSAALLQLLSVGQVPGVAAGRALLESTTNNATFTDDEIKEVIAALKGLLVISDSDVDGIVFNATDSEVDAASTKLQGPNRRTKKKIQKKLLKKINKARKKRGVQKLCLNAKLASAAQRHTNDMFHQRRVMAKGSDGSDWMQRAYEAKYNFKLKCISELSSFSSGTSAFWDSIKGNSGAFEVAMKPCFRHIGFARTNLAGKDQGQYQTLVLADTGRVEPCM